MRVNALLQIERLVDFDETIGDAYLSAADTSPSAPQAFGVCTPGLDALSVRAALRRVTLAHIGKALVMLCGSAYRNKVSRISQL